MDKYHLSNDMKHISASDITGFKPSKINKIIFNTIATDEVNIKTISEFLSDNKKSIDDNRMKRLIKIKDLDEIISILKRIVYSK